MRLKFDNYISENKLFTRRDKLLLAVSGGADSMALLCLLWENNYDFGIAHCNFQLRGEESDADEKFVERFASFVTSNFHKRRFDTEGVALAQKKAIQETARDLRYEWFEELRQKEGYQYILTAHHASDSVETMLFNLSRGTGLKGLTGIKPKNGHLIRPLLGMTKADVLAYIDDYKIPFREDSSNESDKYSRNFIRHQIVPKFGELNPEFEQNVLNTIHRLEEAQKLIDFSIASIRTQIVKTSGTQTRIALEDLKKMPANKAILFEILKTYGFNGQHVFDILNDAKTGAKFYSSTHELLIDRKEIIVQLIDNQRNKDITRTYTVGYRKVIAKEGYFNISEKTKAVSFNDCRLVMTRLNEPKPSINTQKNTAQLNYSQLIFPLKLRHWQTADRFQPLGMNGNSQLLSDYFQQQKLSEFDKKSVWILENGDGRICWVVGYRLAEPFKLMEKTKEYLEIKFG
ncbi:MAG: tRNA lysidine(34) synthetase TilS [Saprospiraceae bacterium]|nr:tRNA lysidine(34) synthetase TilS [Saprospiraceae bacterium]